ncbi:MAG: alpha/beta hydrolase [Pseudomonadota bacterium]
MPLLRVSVVDGEARLHKSPAPLRPALRRGLAEDGPVMILIHGYKFDPAQTAKDPHAHIFGYAPKGDFKAVSWPAHLGFGRSDGREGLCIAFGWPARGWFWDVYEEAARASRALAALVREIRALSPRRPVHILAHSLGARVGLGALPHLAEGDIGRAIMLGGCEYVSRAEAALDSSAGRSAEILNVTSRENDVYELLFERLVRPARLSDRGIGMGLKAPRPNWVDIQIDHPDTRRLLAAFGLPIAEGRHRVCHWSTYNRRGVMRFYAECLRHPRTLSLPTLAARLPGQEPRFSRLVTLPGLPALLPTGLSRPS